MGGHSAEKTNLADHIKKKKKIPKFSGFRTFGGATWKKKKNTKFSKQKGFIEIFQNISLEVIDFPFSFLCWNVFCCSGGLWSLGESLEEQQRRLRSIGLQGIQQVIEWLEFQLGAVCFPTTKKSKQFWMWNSCVWNFLSFNNGHRERKRFGILIIWLAGCPYMYDVSIQPYFLPFAMVSAKDHQSNAFQVLF